MWIRMKTSQCLPDLGIMEDCLSIATVVLLAIGRDWLIPWNLAIVTQLP